MAVDDDAGLSGARAWVSWVLASLCLLFQFVVQLQPSAMIGELETAFKIDAGQLGQLTAAYFATYLVLQVPVGWLLDHIGPRIVLAISMVLTCCGLIWFGYADSLGWATAARVGLGVAGAPAFPAAALVAARWFPARRFALMMGMTESFTLLGGVVVDTALPQMQLVLGRNYSGLILGGAAGLLAIACGVCIRDHPQTHSKGQSSEGPVARTSRGSIIHTVFNARLWLAAVHGGLFFGVVAAFGGLWAVPFLRARLDLVESSAIGLLAILFIAGAIGAPILGLASSKVSWRAPVLITASVICSAAAAAVVYMPGGIVMIAILLGVLGFVAGAFAINLAVVRDVVVESRRGLAMGIANFVFGVIGGPVLLLGIGIALDAQSASESISPMAASLDQIRGALAWFVGALALLIPLGIVLLWLVRISDRSREPLID